MVALMAPVLVGFTALTVDVGRLYVRKQALSNGVDAAALAGGRELPNEEAATNEVMRVAAANQIDTRQVRTQFAHRGDLLARTQDTSGGSPPNYLKVGATEPVPMTFARIFGIESWPVDASAAVAVSGGDKPVNTVPSGSTPFGVDRNAITGDGNVSVIIHACAFQQFWVLPFGNQPDAVKNMIANGNPNTVSAGDLIDVASPKNPNYWYSVISGVDERINRADASPVYSSQTPSTATASNPRVVIVALVEPANGGSDRSDTTRVNILGFAAVYLMGPIRQERTPEGAKQYFLDGKLVDIVTPDATYDPNRPATDPAVTRQLEQSGGLLQPLKLRLVE
jgi:hypothetical protein